MKNKLYRNPRIEIRNSPVSGYGVFATHDIKSGSIIEECHHIVIPKDILPAPILRDYRFWSNKDKSYYSIVFGCGSIFNSSEDPNMEWYYPKNLSAPFVFRSIKDIKKGEEIFGDYGETLRKKK